MKNQRMRTGNRKARTFRSRFASTFAMALFALLVVGYARPGFAQGSATKTFASAGEASNALFRAAQNSDEPELEAILGAEKEVTSSGDEIEDQLERERFCRKYEEMHRLIREADGSTILYIGAENWPFPIPLVSTNGVWHFDSGAGKREILFRAIGENEATAIQVCDAFASAKKRRGTSETAADPVVGYAQSLVSLTTANGSKTADAVPEQDPHPFQGYYFRTGKKTDRAALIAYPAKYRATGVMTFLVTQDGVVYEKDLGPNTKTVAPETTVHHLDSSWHVAE
jgi:hypothetical protein